MFNFKSPFIWLSISLTCCALALGLIPQLRSDAVLAVPVETAPNSTAAESLDDGTMKTARSDFEFFGREILKKVDQMPVFPGKKCGDIKDYRKRKECADQAMLKYIYGNIRYPKKARDKGVEGMAVVRFVVEPHGAITGIKVVRNPGSGLGKAAAKVVKKMKEDGLRWEPGIHKGKPVHVEFNLPVKFKLE